MTRIDAVFVDASEFARAIDVLSTLWFVLRRQALAIRKWITGWEFLRTAAKRNVTANVALRVLGTGRTFGARIDATIVFARQMLRAFLITGAFGSLAENFRIAEIAWSAATGGSMIFTVTFGIYRTVVANYAGVYATSLVTGFRVRTLDVGFAFD